MDDVYELFQRGMRLLESGDFHQATVPLAQGGRDRAGEDVDPRGARPGAASARGRYEEAAVEFAAVVERAPTNDYALFCLGRSLLECGRPDEARKPLVLAANLRPDRRDYRIYRDRARARAA